MIPKPLFLLIFFLCLTVTSCNKATPAGFWKNYQKDLIEKDISDEGPYGGHRAIYWKSNKADPFNSSNVLDFAKKNGWTLVGSSIFSSVQTSKWTYANQAIFPLTHTGFSDKQFNNADLTNFPRWFGGQVVIYRFKTGWLTLEPGTDNSIEENGFVMISRDGDEMSVYHLWGE
jgi:hypothetical protein